MSRAKPTNAVGRAGVPDISPVCGLTETELRVFHEARLRLGKLFSTLYQQAPAAFTCEIGEILMLLQRIDVPEPGRQLLMEIAL